MGKVDAADEDEVDNTINNEADVSKGQQGKVSLFQQRLKAIPFNAWLQIAAVCVIPVTQYVSLSLLPIYLHSVHNMSEAESGDKTSFVWWFCITAPFWGLLSDSPRVGRLHMQLIGTMVAIVCFCLIAVGFSGNLLLALLGTSFAILDQNAYACVEAFVTDKQLTGFVYGMMGALFNIAMGCIEYLSGHVLVAQMPIVYAGSLSIGFVLTCCLLLRLNPSDAAAVGLLPCRQSLTTADETLPEPQHVGASFEQGLPEVAAEDASMSSGYV